MGHHGSGSVNDPFFQCGTCDAEFSAGLQARDNHCLATGHYPPFFECDRCSEVFSNGEAKWNHMTNQNHFAFECERCGETYPGEEELNDHCQSKLCSRLECSLCQVVFPSLGRLLKHERFDHLQCSSCDEFFRNVDAMHIHLDSKHHVQGSRGLQYGGSTELFEQGMRCPFCDRRFRTAGCVAQHLESNNCPSAPPLTRDELYYLIHGKDPNRLLTGNLTEWKGIHTPTWSFDSHGLECYLCGKAFTWGHSLCQHINSETHQQKLYHCPNKECQREFTSLGAVMQHLQCEKCHYMTFDQAQGKFGQIIAPPPGQQLGQIGY